MSDYPEVNQTVEGWARSAQNLADYLTNEVGAPTIITYEEFKNPNAAINYSNMRGIFFQPGVPHIDVINNGYVGSGVHFSREVWYWPTK